MDLKKTLAFAEDLALNVGKILLDEAGKVKILDYKDKQDIVTSVDIKAETLIIESIKKEFKDHAIYSEEAGGEINKDGYLWIVDPLDGTKEYTRSIPMYNTCFALEKDSEPILSVVFRPSNNTLYSAAKGVGAFKNKKRVSMSKQDKLDHSFVFSYLPTYKVDESLAKKKWNTLYKLSRCAYRLRGIAEESASLCWVGSGMIEASVNLGPQPKWHDIVPGMFFAKVAGAKVTDIYGKDIKNRNLSNGFVVSNKLIHDELIKITSK